MNVKIKDKETIVSMLKATQNILDEIKLTFTPESLTWCGVSEDHITCIESKINAGFFATYNVNGTEEFNVDTKRLLDVLQRAPKNEEIQITDGVGSTLIVEFDNQNFYIRTYEELVRNMPPSYECDNVIMVSFDDFYKTINNAGLYGDYVYFTTDNDYIVVGAESVDGKYLGFVDHESECNAVTVCKFNRKYIDYFKGLKGFEEIGVWLVENKPLVLSVVDLFEDISCKFYIAPCIEQEG